MKETFLKTVDMHQGIIHKILSIYTDHEEDRRDLMQEILLQLWKSYPAFSGRSSFSTWMYKVALNTALLQKRKRRNEIISQETTVERLSSQLNLDRNDMIISLYMAIDQLGPIDKAIALLYLEQKKYIEIEEILGMSKNNVGIRLSRIKKKLRKILEYERQ
jgi:RNA polymerase sigma-70 factor (ECF subfamily)